MKKNLIYATFWIIILREKIKYFFLNLKNFCKLVPLILVFLFPKINLENDFV